MTVPDRFTCEQAFRKLADYLDRELQPAETRLVEEHLAVCQVCAGEYRFEASLLDGIRAKVRQAALPPDLLTKVLDQLGREERDRPPD